MQSIPVAHQTGQNLMMIRLSPLFQNQTFKNQPTSLTGERYRFKNHTYVEQGDPPSIPMTPTAPSASSYPANPASTNMPSSTMPSFAGTLFGRRWNALPTYGTNPANTNMPSANMPSFGQIHHNTTYGTNPANTNMPSALMPSFGGCCMTAQGAKIKFAETSQNTGPSAAGSAPNPSGVSPNSGSNQSGGSNSSGGGSGSVSGKLFSILA